MPIEFLQRVSIVLFGPYGMNWRKHAARMALLHAPPAGFYNYQQTNYDRYTLPHPGQIEEMAIHTTSVLLTQTISDTELKANLKSLLIIQNRLMLGMKSIPSLRNKG